MKRSSVRIAAVAAVPLGLVLFLYFSNQGGVRQAVAARIPSLGSKLSNRSDSPDGSQYSWEQRILIAREGNDAEGVNRALIEWGKQSPEAALAYFLREFCQPDLNTAQQKTQADLYYMIRKLTEMIGGLDAEKGAKILAITNDPSVKSAMVWGLTLSLVNAGKKEEAISMFRRLSPEVQDVSGNNFFVVLMNADPAGAVSLMESLKLRGDSLGGLVQVWSQKDWVSALRWLKEYSGTETDPQSAARIAISVANLDRSEVEAFLKMLSPDEAAAAKTMIAGERLSRNFEEGARWAFENLDQAQIDGFVGKALLKNLGELDPALALDLSGKLTGAAKTSAQYAIGKSYAEGSTPEAALKWLEGMGAGGVNNDIFSGIMAAWVDSDPTAAFNYANEAKSYELQDVVVVRMTESMAKSGKITDETLKWIVAAKLEGESLDAAASVVAMYSPSDAAKLISSSPAVGDNVTRGVASKLAEENPQEAAAWASSLSGPGKASAVSDAVAVWAAKDAAAAYSWIMSDLDQTIFDEVVHTAVANISNAPVDVKKKYLSLISDWKVRNETARMLGVSP